MKNLVLYTALAVLFCATLLLAFEIVRLKAEIASADKEQAVFMEKLGFFKAKAVSQRKILREYEIMWSQKPPERVAVVEKATFEHKTRTTAQKSSSASAKQLDTEALSRWGTVALDCIPIPWSDDRLTLEAYEQKTDALTYSLSQRFKLIGTYLADERGTIKFGKLSLDEMNQTGEVLGTAEIIDYELMSSKPPVRKIAFGVRAGVEMSFDELDSGLQPVALFAGPDINIGRFSMGCQLNIPVQQSDSATANIKNPSLLVSAGWRW